MAGDFSAPAPQKPKIAPTVPLASADAERQKLYGPLVEEQERLKSLEKPIDLESAPPPPVKPPDPPAEPAEPPIPPLAEPTDADKQAFTASILGGKRYEKMYVIFGNVQVFFQDRTSKQTEMMFDEMRTMETQGRIKTDEDWLLWSERFKLVLQLRSMEVPQQPKKIWEECPIEEVRKLLDNLLTMPKPLYSALMELCRIFEIHVETLTNKASDPSFWTPVTPGSPSARRGQGRSITGISGVTAGTGS